MATANYKKLENELYYLQKEHQLLKEEQIKLKKEQQNKFRRFVVFAVVLFLVLSGITGVASYSLAAGQVSYTAKDTTWEVENTKDAIDELRDNIGASLVGSVYSYMGTSAPYGYLACDGTEYDISDYPRLANHINKHFGSTNYFGGDGTTTFKVPDLRGEFLRGTGTNSHANQGSGATVGTHQNATRIIAVGSDSNIVYPQYETASDMDFGTLTTGGRWYGSSKTSATSVSGVITTRPTNTSVLYIIKY